MTTGKHILICVALFLSVTMLTGKHMRPVLKSHDAHVNLLSLRKFVSVIAHVIDQLNPVLRFKTIFRLVCRMNHLM